MSSKRDGIRAHKRRLKRAKRKRRERDREVRKLYGRRGHNSCGRKVRYPSRMAAELKAARIEAVRRPVELRVYRCAICGGWHLTHKRKLG